MIDVLIFATLNGLVTGLLLFLLASGLTLIFSMMGVLNFAHASFYMLGAYCAFSIGQYTGFWPALILAPVLVGGFGALVERYGLRHVHKSGHVAELVFTFGLAFLIEQAVQSFWGADTKNYQPPALLDFPLFTLFGQDFPAYKAFMLLVSIGIFIGLYWGLTRTRTGMIIQAATSHPQTVANLGHNLPLIHTLVFGAGSALAALAGVLAGPVLTTFPGMAATLGSIVFVIVVIGGLGSLTGALVASLLIGLLQSWAIAVDVGMADLLHWVGVEFPPDHPLKDIWRLSLPQLAPVLPYLLLVLMLIFHPSGLFGKREG
ncbi:MAG: branched-chain amino acid ABC transporter permease [Pseudomonadales bacterium]|nr:branched-chain amino acid ABC transporter permease [Pseudomonadales bacterium]